ncbi:MAG TPA: hypothetical protein VME22_28740 [Solirubrobacteraceae bacterium]|nr:hypothetical protein [Solirubrobacteraceae bacterium]
MIEDRNADVTGLWECLVDDAYRAWLGAEDECDRILQVWFNGSDDTNEIVYLVYRAALDREEVCARELQRLWELPDADRGNLVHQAPTMGRS